MNTHRQENSPAGEPVCRRCRGRAVELAARALLGRGAQTVEARARRKGSPSRASATTPSAHSTPAHVSTPLRVEIDAGFLCSKHVTRAETQDEGLPRATKTTMACIAVPFAVAGYGVAGLMRAVRGGRSSKASAKVSPDVLLWVDHGPPVRRIAFPKTKSDLPDSPNSSIWDAADAWAFECGPSKRRDLEKVELWLQASRPTTSGCGARLDDTKDYENMRPNGPYVSTKKPTRLKKLKSQPSYRETCSDRKSNNSSSAKLSRAPTTFARSAGSL